MHQRGCKA